MNCLHPIPVEVEKKNGRKVKILAPCGRCESCLVNRKANWSFRLFHEMASADSAYFITLTYSDNCLLYNGVTPTVSKKHVQKFLKRLRKRVYPFKIRYFAVSEYGSYTHRPHYHIILFNFPNQFNVLEYLETCWGKGFVTVSPLNEQRINYTCKYTLNSLNDDDEFFRYRDRNFLLCSKGIGRCYADDVQNRNYHKRNKQPFIKKGDSYISLPRYLKEKIFTYEELDEISKENEKRSLDEWHKLHDVLDSLPLSERVSYFKKYCKKHFMSEDQQNDFIRRTRKKAKDGKI